MNGLKTTIQAIQEYWNSRIHDQEMTENPVGTKAFFDDLEVYRYDKLRYLPKVVDFNGFSGKTLLEIGCGIGTDLVRFAKGGAIVTGVDLSPKAIDLAKENFKCHQVEGSLRVDNGESLNYPDNNFDVVYAHGVLQYTADIQKMITQAHRVLKPGGLFIGMVYNRKGWLNTMSKLFKVGLEHADAPGLTLYTIKELKGFLSQFEKVTIFPERFPVKSKLHKGLKAVLFNTIFVGLFNLIPRPLVRNLGWHIMAFGVKGAEA